MPDRRVPGPHCPRYLIAFDRDLLPQHEVDVLVIGGGVAGASAALAAAEQGASVLLLTKGPLSEGNTAYAQGGIAAVLDQSECESGDSVRQHVQDTLQAGSSFNREPAVSSILGEAAEALDDLRRYGCVFDLDDQGGVALTREGGHSARRILHAGGDSTGREIARTLSDAACNHPRIQVHTEVFVLDLLRDHDRVVGALYDYAGSQQLAMAPAVVLATGGSGRLYRETSNPRLATGDGLAMAYRAGAKLVDLEFVQFHPTCLYIAGTPRHLITEAMRGEGAWLVNNDGERFMPHYHERAELAPRDVVSQAIVKEIASSCFQHVWLNATHLQADFLRARFPTIYATCAELQIDITRDWIPVHPAAHYHCGGVSSDLHGRSSLPGLWVAGEVACTGLNGANRLASNSLLEGLVMGRRAGQEAAAAETLTAGRIWHDSDRPPIAIDVDDLIRSSRSLMWRQAGLTRHQSGLDTACRSLGFWMQHQARGRFAERSGWEMQNMLLASALIAYAARARPGSLGTHLRTDDDGSQPGEHIVLIREER